MRTKPIIIPTQGQLPIYGGITGPILSPCIISIDTIRDLVAMRIDVDEVMLTSDGKYRLDKDNKLVTVRLDLNNYDKINTVPEEQPHYYEMSQPSQPVEETTVPAEAVTEEETDKEEVKSSGDASDETSEQQGNQKKKNKQKK